MCQHSISECLALSSKVNPAGRPIIPAPAEL